MENFHLVVDDDDAMYMTELVKEEIHVYVEHPINDHILVDEGEDVSEGMQPLAVEQGPMGYYSDYSDGSDDDDHDGVNLTVFMIVMACMLMIKLLILMFPLRGSGLNAEVELNHGVRDFVEDCSDSWDCKDDDDVVESSQIGAGVMNSNYESEELHSLMESSSNDELGYDSDDDVEDDKSTHVGNRKASRARDKAGEYVDGAYTQQYNQLWEYCEELRKSSLGSTILMKVHTFNDGDLAAEMDLVTTSAPSQAKIASTAPFAPHQASMHSFSPSATPQFSMHSPSTLSASYQFKPSAPSRSRTRLVTQFAPYQTSVHHSSNSSNPTLRQKKKRVVTLEDLKASKNASRYMEAIRHAGSQSFVQGPRK
nr:hypothetical protein CFP56_61035 [Quercus suber]